MKKKISSLEKVSKIVSSLKIKSKKIYQERKMSPESRGDFKKDAREKSVSENRKLGI